MTKRVNKSRLAMGAALRCSAVTPALATGSVTPGFIWIGQASGDGAAGTGAAGTGTAGTGTNSAGVGATGTGPSNSTSTTGTGTGSNASGTGTGSAGTGIGAAGTTMAPGTAATPGTTTPGTTAPGTTAPGTTPGTGNPAGTPGTMGTNSPGVTGSPSGTNNAGGGPIGSVPSPGAAGAAQTFTLGQTIQAALQTSADILTATRNVEIDRRRADEAAAAGRPNVGASGTAIRYDKATDIALGGGSAYSSDAEPSGNPAIQYRRPIGPHRANSGGIRSSASAKPGRHVCSRPAA